MKKQRRTASTAIALALAENIYKYQAKLERRKRRTAAENRHLLAIRSLSLVLTDRKETL